MVIIKKFGSIQAHSSNTRRLGVLLLLPVSPVILFSVALER